MHVFVQRMILVKLIYPVDLDLTSMTGRARRTRLVAIKNFDEELYRLVKTYAALTDGTVASIIEEALRSWMRGREDYDEVRAWVSLEREYEENMEALKEGSPGGNGSGYVLICGGRVVDLFRAYGDAARASRESCDVQALIVKLPYSEGRVVELGLPW